MSINMKQTVVHLYNGILFSSKKEQTTNTCNTINDSQKHYAQRKKPDSKVYILYGSIYTFGKRKTIGTEIQSAVVRGLRVGEVQRGVTELFRVIEILHTLIVVIVT